MSSHPPINIFVEGPLSPELVSEILSKHNQRTEIGAHSIFLGQVRSDPMGTPEPTKTDPMGTPEPPESADPLAHDRVKAIHYTAYEEMALEKMQEIRDRLFERYPLTCLHVYHSLGLVPAGALSLLIFTSAPHRRAAIDACTELVESIKAQLPIWGQELSDNLSHWKTNK
jgi:molybdopterin synthase catalytic subunit